MGQMMESVKTVNSVLRTLLMTVIVGGASAASYFGYQFLHKQEIQAREQEARLRAAQEELTLTQQTLMLKEQEVGELQDEVERQKQEIQRLDTSLRLLKVDHRVARLDVIEQRRKPDSDEVITVIEFAELTDDGQPLDEPKRFEVRGDVVYLDYWLVKFDDRFVEQAEIDRNTSLVLFRRVFGERQEPKDGFVIDRPDRPPRAYTRGGVVSEFERRIWSDFWNIANDEQKARDLGIRAAHGQAVSIKAQPGKSYRIQLRASDGLSILPEGVPPPKPGRPAA